MISKKFTKTNAFLGSLIALFLVSTIVVSANTIVRSGEIVSISEDQVIDGDFYGAAGTVNVSGVIEEDAVITGGQITINGNIGANAFLLAGGVDVHGPVGDDLRIISGEVTIAEPVNGDLFVMAGSVDILSSASIEGDVLIYGGEVTIEAPVKGDILGNMGSLRIDSAVAGDVDVTVTDLTLGDKTTIDGSVTYVSANEVIKALNASIAGEEIRNDPVLPTRESTDLSWILPSLMLIFATLAWYLVSRKTLNLVVDRALVKSIKPLLVGIAVLVLTPIAIALLFISMIGAVVGVALLLLYTLLLLLSFIGLVAVLGKLIEIGISKSKKQVSAVTILVGFVAYGILSMLPALGSVIIFVVMLITLGSLFEFLLKISKGN